MDQNHELKKYQKTSLSESKLYLKLHILKKILTIIQKLASFPQYKASFH